MRLIQPYMQLIDLFASFLQLDSKYVLILLDLGQAVAQLLLRPFLHIHIIIILELPVIVLVDTGGRGLKIDSQASFGIPEKMDREAQYKCSKFADDYFRNAHGQLKSKNCAQVD